MRASCCLVVREFALVLVVAALAQPDRNEEAHDGQRDESFDERAPEAPVSDYPCESSHSPPTV